MKMSKFTCAVIAGSIALTSAFTTAVQAGGRGDKLATILLGAAAVGLVAHTIHKNKKSRAKVTQYDHYDAYRPNKPRVRYNDHRPRTCLRKKYTNHGWKTFYSRKCLEQHRVRRNSGYAGAHGHNHNRYNHQRYNQQTRYDRHGSRYHYKTGSDK